MKEVVTYDLHGLSINEATGRLFIILGLFEENGGSVIKIITGKGRGILQSLVEDFLCAEGWNFSQKKEEGIFFVFQR